MNVNIQKYMDMLTLDNLYRVIEWCIQFMLDICIALLLFAAMTAIFNYWVALIVFVVISIAQFFMRMDGVDPTVLQRGYLKRTVTNVRGFFTKANTEAKATAETTIIKAKDLVARAPRIRIILSDGTPVTPATIN